MHAYEHLIGTELGRGRWSWDEETVMLYAVGVGAGLDDPTRDLHLTTENTPGQSLMVLPTFLTQMDGPGNWSSLLGWGRFGRLFFRLGLGSSFLVLPVGWRRGR